MVQFSSDHLRELCCCFVQEREDGELQLLNIWLLSYEGEHLQPHVTDLFLFSYTINDISFLKIPKTSAFSSVVWSFIDNIIIGTDAIYSFFFCIHSWHNWTHNKGFFLIDTLKLASIKIKKCKTKRQLKKYENFAEEEPFETSHHPCGDYPCISNVRGQMTLSGSLWPVALARDWQHNCTPWASRAICTPKMSPWCF